MAKEVLRIQSMVTSQPVPVLSCRSHTKLTVPPTKLPLTTFWSLVCVENNC